MSKIDELFTVIDEVQVALARLKISLKGFTEETSIGEFGVKPRNTNDFKEQFLAILQKNRFNKTKVAKMYGVGRRTIYRWMKAYGID